MFCATGTPTAWVRGCSDLYLDEAGVIWVATAQDFGDAGPFYSTVYRFSPPGLTFLAPVEVRIPFEGDAENASMYCRCSASTASSKSSVV